MKRRSLQPSLYIHNFPHSIVATSAHKAIVTKVVSVKFMASHPSRCTSLWSLAQHILTQYSPHFHACQTWRTLHNILDMILSRFRNNTWSCCSDGRNAQNSRAKSVTRTALPEIPLMSLPLSAKDHLFRIGNTRAHDNMYIIYMIGSRTGLLRWELIQIKS